MPGNEGVDRQSLGVRAAAMARVNWSVNIESAFRAVPDEGAVDSGKAGARRKKALASIQIFGKDQNCEVSIIPGFAGHRPAFHGGFCVSRLRESPRPAPCRRNYQSVVICADSSSRKTAGIIVLLAVRKPASNQGTTSRQPARS
jgi:hypothetical protein